MLWNSFYDSNDMGSRYVYGAFDLRLKFFPLQAPNNLNRWFFLKYWFRNNQKHCRNRRSFMGWKSEGLLGLRILMILVRRFLEWGERNPSFFPFFKTCFEKNLMRSKLPRHYPRWPNLIKSITFITVSICCYVENMAFIVKFNDDPYSNDLIHTIIEAKRKKRAKV